MKPLLIAHRGGALEAFENSPSAFHHAIKIGCDSIEADLRATRDGKIIILHDETLERTTWGRGKVRDCDLEQIRKIPLQNGEPIPTLEQLFRLAKHKISLHLEVKESGFEASLAEAITAAGLLDSVYVVSFLPETLLRVHHLERRITLGFLFDNESDWRNCPEFCELILPSADLLNEKTVENFGVPGKTIHAWVVNDKNRASRLISLGVTGIVSDAPGSIMPALRI